MMCQKEFIVLSNALRSTKPTLQDSIDVWTTWEKMILAISDTCAFLNPRFKRELFLEACGL